MSAPISVQLDAVEALGAELTHLAGDLSEVAGSCAATPNRFQAALPGDTGWQAGVTGAAWAALVALLADRTRAVAATLVAAVADYRATDRDLAAAIAVAAGPGSADDAAGRARATGPR